MAFDIKAKIEELVNKIKNDKDLTAKFQKDPAGTVKELTGVEIPEEQLNKLVDGIKAKISLDKLGGLFGKK